MNPVRRFAAALRERRWSHVVIELALLITGILIALAVDGWIDGRRDARLERQYLELLSRDLDRDIKVLAFPAPDRGERASVPKEKILDLSARLDAAG